MPGRTSPFQTSVSGMSDGSDSYRYGFNGKENDFEPKNGQGTQQDYGMRIYDPRLGKFLSVDPLTKGYPMLTPYQFASNRPIDGVDLDGKEWSSSGKVFNLQTGKVEINYTVKLHLVNATYINRESIRNVVENVYIPYAEDLLSNTEAKGTMEDPVVNVDIQLDAENTQSLMWSPLTLVINSEAISDGEIVNGWSRGNSQVGEIHLGLGVNGQPRNALDIGETFGHELGHQASLDHPWEIKTKTDLDAKQLLGPIWKNAAQKSKIVKNLMNSSANPDPELRFRAPDAKLSKGQYLKIEETVQEEQ